jgi:hypothetical protein
MSWGEMALRLVVRGRDRDTISGDLLEEYREEILPKRGAIRARLWYARQVVSFVRPVTWGLLIGAAAGTLQLLSTALDPLADDSAGVMLVIAATLLLLWMLASLGATTSAQRLRDVVVSGIVIGAATMAVAYVSSIVRVNLFLDQIRDRADWVNLVSRFRASEFHSLRAYANHEYLGSLPSLLALGAVAGGCCGALGGALRRAARDHSAAVVQRD